MEFLCNGVSDLPEAAETILKEHPGRKVFALYGQMGAGKTTLIKALCRVLGVEENVSSPTFSILNEYRNTNGESVFHFDFYRIKNQQEAMDIGYEDYVYSGDYVFIEWPEKVEKLLPENYVYVQINETGEPEKRIISF